MPRLLLSRPQPFSLPMPAISDNTIVSGVICGIVWCCVVLCCVVWCGVVWCGVVESYRGVFCS